MRSAQVLLFTAASIVLGPALLPAQQPRDGTTPPQRTGSAVVTGLVISTDAPAGPVRRARVMLTSPALPMRIAGITDDEGRFRIERIPPGQYSVEAVKDGYLTTALGAPRPGRPGRRLTLVDGREESVTLSLTRGSVISGTIVDAQGAPVPFVNVTAQRFSYHATTGERLPMASASAASDDRGAYRIFGLAPGDYLVAASTTGPLQPLQTPSAADIKRAMAAAAAARPSNVSKQPGMPPPPSVPRGLVPAAPLGRAVALAPVFHPGATRVAHARVITLGRAEERHGIDITLEHVPVATVEGLVTGPDGPTSAVVVLVSADAQPGQVGEFVRVNQPGPSGEFRFPNVPPGEYHVVAMRGMETRLWASAPVVVDGDDVTGVALALAPTPTLSGRLVFEGGAPPAALLSILKTSLLVLPAIGGPQMPPVLQTSADGRFTISGIPPGPLRPPAALRGIRTPLGGWWLQSVVVGGRELLDAPLDIRTSIDDAVVTFSARASELSGAVTDASGAPVSGPYLIAFSANRAHWYPMSRRVVAVPLPPDGRYRIENLPPGDYLLVVDADVEPGEWYDPEYLGRVAGRAARVSIGAYEKALRNLRVPGG